MELPGPKKSMKLLGVCIFALALSFTWLIFDNLFTFLAYSLFGSNDFCMVGQPCMFLLSLLPDLDVAVQIAADVLGAFLIHNFMMRHELLARDGRLAKTAKIWALTLILFVPVLFLASWLANNALDECYGACGGSPMCGAHCPATSGADFIYYVAIVSAVVGVHNPITFFLAGYLVKNKQAKRP